MRLTVHCAHLKLLAVYSCPQYTNVDAGNSASLSNAVAICCGVPSLKFPHPLMKRVSPVNTAGGGGGGDSAGVAAAAPLLPAAAAAAPSGSTKKHT